MPDLRTTLEQAGLIPGEIAPDGKIRRCPTVDKPRSDNGWYVLHVGGLSAVWGDWSTGSGAPVGKWREDATAIEIDPAKASQSRQKARLRAQAMARMAKEAAAAAEARARQVWRDSRPYTGHPYVRDKGLTSAGCSAMRLWTGTVSRTLRTHPDGSREFERIDDTWLVVPMMRGKEVVSVQRISSSGLKLNMPGVSPVGLHCEIPRAAAAVTILCEGPATGLAIFQCVRSARVIICFTADNLAPAAEAVRPTGSVVIAADNDHGTFLRKGVNPGLDKAREAAKMLGCGVAYPEGIEGTDFADALAEWGQDGRKKVERIILSGIKYIPKGVNIR